MANLFQPVLDAIRPVADVVSPVVDKGGAILAEGAAKLGLAAYTGYQQNKLEESLAKDFEEYFTPSESPDQRQALIDVGAGEAAVSTMFDKMPDNLEGVKALDMVNKRLDSSLAKYQQAAREGRMSLQELEVRILKTTREAVSNNPWLEQELLGTAKKFMEVSGAKDWIAAQQKSAASQAQMDEWYQKEAAKVGINPMNDPLYKEKVILHNRAVTNYDLAEKEAKTDERKQEQYFNNPAIFNGITEGANSKFSSSLNIVVNDPSLTPQQKAILLDRVANEQISSYQGVFGKNSNSPQVATTVDGMKRLAQTYQDFASGKLTKDALEAQVATNKAAADIGLGQYETRAILDVLKGLPDPVANSIVTSEKYQKRVSAMSEALLGNGFGDSTTKGQDGTLIDAAISNAAKKIKENPADNKEMANLFQSFSKTMRDENLSPAARTQWADKFVASVVTTGPVYQTLEPGQKAQMAQDIREYFDQAMQLAKNATIYYDGTPISRPADLEVDILKDGTVMFFSASSPADAVKMTKEFGSRINNSIKALSHLEGTQDYYAAMKNTQIGLLVASAFDVRMVEKSGEDKPMPSGADPRWAAERQISEETQAQRDNVRRGLLEEERAKALASGNTESVRLLDKELATLPPRIEAAQSIVKDTWERVKDKDTRLELEGKYGRGNIPEQVIRENPEAFTKGELKAVTPQKSPLLDVSKTKDIPTPFKVSPEAVGKKSPVKPVVKSTPLSKYEKGEKYYLKNFRRTSDTGGIYTIVNSRGQEFFISNKATYDAFMNKFRDKNGKPIRPENLPKWEGK